MWRPTFRNIFTVTMLAILRVTSSQMVPVDPPIVDVTNNAQGLNGDEMNRKYDITVRKYTIVNPKPEPVSSTSHAKTTSTAVKRDVYSNKVDDFPTIPPEENLLDSEDLSDCAFTFTLPNPTPQNQQVCIRNLDSVAAQGPDDVTLSILQDKLLSTQQAVEELRTEMTNQLGTARIATLQNDVRLLQKESRNMNFRVSQLYMQLLHEIIRKRDDTIELTTMENSVLNVTVKYYELRDKHQILARDHEKLKQNSQAQEQQIQTLQGKMEELTRRMNRIALRAEDTPPPEIAEQRVAIITRRNFTEPPTENTEAPSTDCLDIQNAGNTESRVYSLNLPSMNKKIKVWCDFAQDPGGWTVIQRRTNRKVNFYRNMQSYQRGFGYQDSDFWLGLDNINALTNQPDKNYKLHIDLEDWNGRKTFVEYGSFKVAGEDDGYRLKVAHYSGNAGDSLTWHNNMKFTTKNNDNDPFVKNCANYQKGGWWYNMCAHSNLNGIYYSGGHYRSTYQDGIYWSEWRGGSYSLKKVEMKIRPTE